MPVSRRDFLRAGAVAASLWGLGACSGSSGSGKAGLSGGAPPTTLDQTLLRGSPGSGGYVPLVSGPGEPSLLRSDLGVAAQGGRAARRQPLVSFVQLTDVHIVDAQSPARVEFLDRYDDDPSAPTAKLPFQAAYRPQEMLTAQVAQTMVSTLRQLGKGPVTRQPFAFAISTGDAVDNCQYNELRWVIDLLDGGGSVRPDSGDLTRWEGVADDDPRYYDPHYWHPDGPPPGQPLDRPQATLGFPRVPGLLDACRRPFDATGLGMPWYAAYGNHDGLIQGNAPLNGGLGQIATGNSKVVGLPPGIDVVSFALSLIRGGKLPEGLPARTVTADRNRRILTRVDVVREHFTTRGRPAGHGFTQANLNDKTAYYTFDLAPSVRGIVLDTVNPGGLSEGSMDQAQFGWLKSQLDASRGKIVVLFSHHTIATMTNTSLAPGETAPRVLGSAVRDLLLQYPSVVLWVNGHTHVNSVIPHPRPGSGGGFWELNTASHIDWPQQSRTVEIVDNKDGTLSVFGTIVDFAAPSADVHRLDSPERLAALSRQLAANDWQERTGHSATVDGRRGSAADRNVELIVADPRGH